MYMHWWKKAHQEPFSLDFFVQKRALIGSWNRLSWRVQVLWKHTHTYQRCEVLVPGYSEINHFLEGSWLFASKKVLWPMFPNRNSILEPTLIWKGPTFTSEDLKWAHFYQDWQLLTQPKKGLLTFDSLLLTFLSHTRL